MVPQGGEGDVRGGEEEEEGEGEGTGEGPGHEGEGHGLVSEGCEGLAEGEGCEDLRETTTMTTMGDAERTEVVKDGEEGNGSGARESRPQPPQAER